MHSILGTWDVSLKTPIGTITAVYRFGEDGQGTATAGGEAVPLDDIRYDGDRVTWRQAVTRPMRLNLDFDVTVDGDTLTGTSRAGRLPGTTVTGRRVTA